MAANVGRASRNRFALVTLAHLCTQRTQQNADDCFTAKWQLTKLLFQRGWSKKRIVVLFNSINWMMPLPEELEERYWRKIRLFERERKMEYISSLEQMFINKGEKKGLAKGRAEGAAMLLEEQLTQRFGPLSLTTRRKLSKASLEQLTTWSKAVLDAQNLKQVFS